MTPSPRSTTHAGLARRALAVTALALVAAATLSACAPDAEAARREEPTASGSPASPSGERSPEPAVTASRPPEELSLTEKLAAAMTSGDTAPIEDHLTEPTRVVIAASEADLQYGTVDAVLALDYVHPGEGPWDFALSPAVVDGYEANPYYGEFFPDDAIVGRSDAAAVVSFVPNGDRIGTIFMAIDEALITDY